jgi:hypothetical protein
MKFQNIYIHTNSSVEKYNKITEILNVKPTDFYEKTKSIYVNNDYFDVWTYQIISNEEEEYFDFINEFLDLLEPKFDELSKVGILKSDITFWLFYEYDQQCSLSYNSQEMKRLGESGIGFNIDCMIKK